MLFNSWTFALFIAIVLPTYYALDHRWQNRFLLAASYFFYSMWDWRFLGLLAISTGVDYVAALRMHETDDALARKRWLQLSLATNLGILGFFKYFNFFLDSTVDMLMLLGFEPHVPTLRVLLPVGISFYTFQTLAYTIDVYRGRMQPTRDLQSFAIYVSFFPQLVAGPIERAQNLLPQLQSKRIVSADHISTGLQLLLWGYLKKVAIADSLVPYQLAAFTGDAPPDGAWVLWLSMWASALQAYCDFSGYSDMARGLGRLLGIQLMVNFQQPFLAPNFTEFWRRWHVSLSTWLRDYVYIPLGGGRVGVARQYRNLFLTMVLGGLWHGANWTFVVWGACCGVLLCVHKWMTWGKKIAIDEHPETAREWLSFVPRVIITFHLFAVTLVILRAPNIVYAWDFLIGMFTPSGARTMDAAFLGLGVTLGFYALLTLALDVSCWRSRHETPFGPSTRPWIRGLAYGAALVILAIVREGNAEEFFYFQF